MPTGCAPDNRRPEKICGTCRYFNPEFPVNGKPAPVCLAIKEMKGGTEYTNPRGTQHYFLPCSRFFVVNKMFPLVRSRFDTPPTKALPKITIKSLLSSFYLSFNPYKPYANADKQYFRLNVNITVVTVDRIHGHAGNNKILIVFQIFTGKKV